MDEAKAQGAVALFGEKYGDIVRVVEVGDYSRELCGGTHVPRTGNVAVVRILHEGSIGAGMRRVEALVGPDALREINAERALLDGLVAALGSQDPQAAIDRARQLAERVKRLESELGKLRQGDVDSRVAQIADAGGRRSTASRLVAAVEDEDPDGLRELAQMVVRQARGRGRAAVVVGNGEGGKAMLVAACSPRRSTAGVTAPALLEAAAAQIGGGAGGKQTWRSRAGRTAAAVRDAVAGIPAPARGAPGRSASMAQTSRPGRVLGLDLGDARIGVAVSDPERRMAVPVGTVHAGSRPGS